MGTRGYLQERQDFLGGECSARAGLALANETTKVNYAGYWSAEEGAAGYPVGWVSAANAIASVARMSAARNPGIPHSASLHAG